jgi:hypothetical protein
MMFLQKLRVLVRCCSVHIISFHLKVVTHESVMLVGAHPCSASIVQREGSCRSDSTSSCAIVSHSRSRPCRRHHQAVEPSVRRLRGLSQLSYASHLIFSVSTMAHMSNLQDHVEHGLHFSRSNEATVFGT